MQRVLLYEWLEDCLKSGELLSEDSYVLKFDPQGEQVPEKSLDPGPTNQSTSSDSQQLHNKKSKLSTEDTKIINHESDDNGRKRAVFSSTSTISSPGEVDNLSYGNKRPQHLDAESEAVSTKIYVPTAEHYFVAIFFIFFHKTNIFICNLH